jgi:hypothetical protein
MLEDRWAQTIFVAWCLGTGALELFPKTDKIKKIILKSRCGLYLTAALRNK